MHSKGGGRSEGEELAGDGVDDVAGHADVTGHEGMVANEVDGLRYCFVDLVEAVEPVVEVDAAVAHQRDVALGDATLLHQAQHLPGVHSLYAAAGVADDHDLLDTEFVDGHEQRAHRGVEGVGDDAPGVLDDLDVAVAQTQCGGKQLYQACVHTRHDCDLLVGIFGSQILLILFVSYKLTVVAQNLVYHDFSIYGFSCKVNKFDLTQRQPNSTFNI